MEAPIPVVVTNSTSTRKKSSIGTDVCASTRTRRAKIGVALVILLLWSCARLLSKNQGLVLQLQGQQQRSSVFSETLHGGTTHADTSRTNAAAATAAAAAAQIASPTPGANDHHLSANTNICHHLLAASASAPAFTVKDTTSTFRIPTPAHIWNHWQDEIIKATMSLEYDHVRGKQPPAATAETITEWGQWLFQTASPPHKMKRGLHLQRFLDRPLASLRILLEQQEQDKHNNRNVRPIRLVVLGGSVPAGTRCALNPFDLPGHDGPKIRYPCVYPSRLSNIFNALLGPGRVVVTNVSLGGTTSDIGALAFKYKLLWNTNEERPDLVLANFAANDLNDLGSWEGMQQMALAVEQQRNCTTGLPMLLYMNEFFAWPSNKMLFHLEMESTLQRLASYHDFTLLSYVEVFRDYVYADLKNLTFRGTWTPKADKHGPRSFHITAAWLIAYTFLEMAFEHCNRAEATTARTNRKYQLPDIPQGPRPWLDKELTFDEMSTKWQQAPCVDPTDSLQCDFVWVANRLGSSVAARTPGGIQDRLQAHGLLVPSSSGWKVGGDVGKNKHGWVASTANASFSLEWTTSSPIESVTILSMLSYGEAWADSRVSMTVNEQAPHEWVGFHDSSTSITVSNVFVLAQPVAANQTIHVDFALTGGTTFKISGMMFCAD